jgi:hypothetical protein
MHVYIAGPMTGYHEHNFPAFHAAAQAWRAKGHVVFNPAEQHGGDTGLPLDVYTRHDVHTLLQVEALALLPGWDHSTGAKIEVLVGTWLGLMFFDAITFAAIAPRVETVAHPLVRQVA